MSRPINKAQLIDQSKFNFKALNDFVDSLSEEEKQTDFLTSTMNRNISDVFAHLHQWHKMMKEWYQTGLKGEKPDIPAKGYTWKTTPELNRKIWEEHRNDNLKFSRSQLLISHQEIMDIIESHADEELFQKKRFKWTGTTSLGAYLISATSSHYDWALKLIKKAKK